MPLYLLTSYYTTYPKILNSIAFEKTVISCTPSPPHVKVSEGMDFSDNRARCVVVTGIPYAPAMDAKVSDTGHVTRKPCQGLFEQHPIAA